jgi:hypothetical protein
MFDLIYFMNNICIIPSHFLSFFAHYKSPHNPKFILHAMFTKTKLKLSMKVIKNDTEIDGS